MTQKAFFALPVAFAAALAAGAANAAVVSYSNFASFSGAVSNLVDHNFEGIAPPQNYVSGNQLVDGVSFVQSAGGNSFVIDANAGYGNYGASFYSGQSSGQNSGNAVRVTSPGTAAIGFFYGSYTDNDDDYAVTLNTGDTFVAPLPGVIGQGINFIGFVSDAALITSVDFQAIGGSVVFDITRFTTADRFVGVPTTVPFALFGLGLAALGIARRRNSVGS